MDGYQMARQIRSEESQRGLPRTPVIALTASALKGEAERCLEAGMDGYGQTGGHRHAGRLFATLATAYARRCRCQSRRQSAHQTENNTQASTASNIADTNILDRSIL